MADIKMYDLLRMDLHLPDDKAREMVEAIGDSVRGHIEESMSRNTDSFNREVGGLKKDLTDMKGDVAILKKDVDVLKKDVDVLKKNVDVLKKNVDVLTKDVDVLKMDVQGIRKDVNSLKEYTEKHYCTKAELLEVRDVLKTGIAEARIEEKKGTTALLKWMIVFWASQMAAVVGLMIQYWK